MKDTIAVFGSARRHGNTGKFIDWIAEELDIEVIDLSEKTISAYDYKHHNKCDDFLPVIKTLLNYNNIIFATPVYWYTPSAQMKIFIDRTSDLLELEELREIGRELRKKTAYIACTSISQDADPAFLDALKNTFSYLGMPYGGYVHANCVNGYIQSNYIEDVSQFLRLVQARATI